MRHAESYSHGVELCGISTRGAPVPASIEQAALADGRLVKSAVVVVSASCWRLVGGSGDERAKHPPDTP